MGVTKKLTQVQESYVKLYMPALKGQIVVDDKYTESNWDRIINSLSIKTERSRLSEELKKIQRSTSQPALANENALDSIYQTYITLNRVEDNDADNTRTAKEKAADLNKKVQELVFSALRALSSEDLALLLAA